jgi:hypothetical protein
VRIVVEGMGEQQQAEQPKVWRSIGADVNWGVRFDDAADVDKFLRVSRLWR